MASHTDHEQILRTLMQTQACFNTFIRQLHPIPSLAEQDGSPSVGICWTETLNPTHSRTSVSVSPVACIWIQEPQGCSPTPVARAEYCTHTCTHMHVCLHVARTPLVPQPAPVLSPLGTHPDLVIRDPLIPLFPGHFNCSQIHPAWIFLLTTLTVTPPFASSHWQNGHMCANPWPDPNSYTHILCKFCSESPAINSIICHLIS